MADDRIRSESGVLLECPQAFDIEINIGDDEKASTIQFSMKKGDNYKQKVKTICKQNVLDGETQIMIEDIVKNYMI